MLLAVFAITIFPSARTTAGVDSSSVQVATPLLRLNSVGFLPNAQKRASIGVRCKDFRVVDEAGRTAYRGTATGPVHNADTNEDLYIADFSGLTTPGKYRLVATGAGESALFAISSAIYDVSFQTVMQGMYLWRCGAAVHATYNGITYAHEACHMEDAWLDTVAGGHVRHPSTGGWHDAGDYNKYVVNAGITVGLMLLAWEQFSDGIRAVKLTLPDTPPGMPSYLAEVKWELDWLLTMQSADGSVYHKLSTKEFGPAILPEKEKTPRYFAPWSSAATADFVATMSMASRVYKRFDPGFAVRCLEAARKSYLFLQAHPTNHPADLKDFKTGSYQTDDDDDRLWAAAELWETTGEAPFLVEFETRSRDFKARFSQDWGWGDVKNLGMITYIQSSRQGRNQQLVNEIREALKTTADAIVRVASAHGYARPLGSSYYWGCNGGVANTTVLLQTAARFYRNPEYAQTALDAIGYLFGRNYFGRSFVTGIGANPPQQPHDRRSMGQPGAPAWPGYLVGGGWPKGNDWKDEAPHYELNEIAINWNAGLIYALAGFLQ